MRTKLWVMLALVVLAVSGSALGTTLTFSEFAAGTIITTQYSADGVVFSGASGSAPKIWPDGAMPGSPVLSPNPPYAGDFNIIFPSGATDVQFDSGFWDSLGTGIVKVYDLGGVQIGATRTNASLAVYHFNLSADGTIGHIYFNSFHDPAGADIDNLHFDATPEPGSLMLLGTGLMGLAGAAFRKLRS